METECWKQSLNHASVEGNMKIFRRIVKYIVLMEASVEAETKEEADFKYEDGNVLDEFDVSCDFSGFETEWKEDV